MQVSVESTGALGRRMTITVPADQVEEAISSRLKRLARQVKLPGFRPGKVPMKVVEQKYSGQVLSEVAGDLIQESFQQAVDKEGLRPAGGPRIQPASVARGKEFEYTAEFEVYPEIPRPNLEGEKIARPTSTVADADIDRTIERLRRQRATWKPVERAAKKGDQLTIDFLGKLDGEPFAGGQATDFRLELGSSALIAGFEEGLAGAKAGEQRHLDIAFPADYGGLHLAGKKAVFEVTVKAVAEPELPEVDEQFIKDLGVASGSMEDFRKEVRNNLEREMQQRLRSLLSTRVLEALLKRNDIEIPAALVNAELQRILQDRQQRGVAAGIVEEDRLQARRRVAIGLVFAEIIKLQGISADAEKMKAHVEDMASQYDQPEEFKRWFFSEPARLREVEGLVLEDQIVAHLLEKADVTEESMSFQELTEATAGHV
jgi:trigger factor